MQKQVTKNILHYHQIKLVTGGILRVKNGSPPQAQMPKLKIHGFYELTSSHLPKTSFSNSYSSTHTPKCSIFPPLTCCLHTSVSNPTPILYLKVTPQSPLT